MIAVEAKDVTVANRRWKEEFIHLGNTFDFLFGEMGPKTVYIFATAKSTVRKMSDHHFMDDWYHDIAVALRKTGE